MAIFFKVISNLLSEPLTIFVSLTITSKMRTTSKMIHPPATQKKGHLIRKPLNAPPPQNKLILTPQRTPPMRRICTQIEVQKYLKAEYVQRHVCFVNVHENVIFSVCALMGNATYIIFIMWSSISGLDT